MDDTASFDRFYQVTRHRVVTFLYALTGDLAEAQDVAQEAYGRAWQRWSTGSTYADPEAWVPTVGYRTFASHWRKSRNRRVAHRRHGAGSPVQPPPDDAVVLVAALRRLPADLRLVIALHHLLDLSVADVAAQTGIPVNTVKARLVRGRRLLAGLIGVQLPEEVTHA